MGDINLVHRLVRDRDGLRPGFARIWSRVGKQSDALIESFARATLELANVNAGPACIEALWQAGLHASPSELRLVWLGGHAAAEICRFAGTRAALACLEVFPTAIRLTMARPAELGSWWCGLHRLSREAPALVHSTARKVEALLATGDGIAFADLVAAGLKATAKDPVRRAAFFALEDPLARALLARRVGMIGFAETERMLTAFVAGLWGGEPRLKAGPAQRRTIIASGTVLLPPVFSGTPPALCRALYRAAVAHAQAHLTTPTMLHAIGTLKPLQVALVGLIEDARVEALAVGRFPGLRRLWMAFHQAQAGGTRTATTLMAGLARGLLDPAYEDPDRFVQKGRGLFAAAADRLEDPMISREIGGLLGNDLGQMRLQFNARTYVVEPAYRDDNMHLWELPETPDDALSMTIDTARGTNGEDDEQSGDGAPTPRAHDTGLDDQPTLLATYPEWDAAAGVERPDWTSLRDTVPVLSDPAPCWAGEAALRARIAQLVRSMVIGRNVPQAPREDGEELDIDIAIRTAIARRASLQPDERVYRDRRPRGRDLATLIILDVSQSTAAIGPTGLSVLAFERLAVEALASALDMRGDKYALRAFSSAGRDDIRLTRLKDFDEPLSTTVAARLAGLTPGLSTRLGAALRHSGAELEPLSTMRKMVLVLTDGEPSDIDVPNPHELVEDARRAVLGLRLKGIDVFGIVMDPEDKGSGPVIFGRHNTITVRRLEELPGRLADVYFRLAQR